MLMISGDRVRKKLIVTSTERSSNVRNTLFNGIAEVVEDGENRKIIYRESDGTTEVTFTAHSDFAHLRRSGEMLTQLHFDQNTTQTVGSVTNELGYLELIIQTQTYICTRNVIAVEYAVLNENEVIESYRLIWKIKDISA